MIRAGWDLPIRWGKRLGNPLQRATAPMTRVDTFHLGVGSHHVSLSINGTRFSGYDYGTGHHYSGSVSGNSVAVYDYGGDGYVSYSL